MNSSTLFNKFREAGYRMTRARKAVLELFETAKGPLSAAEILSSLEKRGIRVNKTTVYREFDFLMEQKVIRELDLLDGSKRYEKVVADDHHHHLVCEGCRQIICLDLPEDFDALERYIKKTHHFKVTSHVLEFFGICKNCQSS